MSLEAAKPGTPEHEWYNALKSLRVQHDLILQEMAIVMSRLGLKDAAEVAEVQAVLDDVKAASITRLAAVESTFDESKPAQTVKGG